MSSEGNVVKVTWNQVFAWRLRRQFIDPRGGATTGEIVSRLCGIQAQVASAADIAVAIRQDTTDDGIKRGLADRSLVKTWAMRGTLHLLRSSEVATYLSLIASARTWEKPTWQRAFGASPKDIAALSDAVSGVLDGVALTRDELVTELVADLRFKGMEEQLRSGWGALLKPLAWQGSLCYGPNRGSKITFTTPTSAIPGWQGLPEPDEAAPVAIAAYLGAYGPATPELFDAWLSRNSLRKTTLRRWFKEMGDRLTEVDVEGRKAFIVTEHADELADTRPSEAVRLLGAFDQYILGPGTKDPELLPTQHRSKVSRAAGWISPLVVMGGRIVGVWELEDSELVVSLFPEVQKPPLDALKGEAQQFARASGRSNVSVRLA